MLAKALDGKDVKDLLTNVGGGGAPAAGAAPAAGGASAEAGGDAAPAEEEKPAEKEESDDDMVRSASKNDLGDGADNLLSDRASVFSTKRSVFHRPPRILPPPVAVFAYAVPIYA